MWHVRITTPSSVELSGWHRTCQERLATFDGFRELLKEGLRRCDESSTGSCQLVDLSRVDSGFPQQSESGPPPVAWGVAGR